MLCSLAWLYGTEYLAAIDNTGHMRVYHEQGGAAMLELPARAARVSGSAEHTFAETVSPCMQKCSYPGGARSGLGVCWPQHPVTVTALVLQNASSWANDLRPRVGCLLVAWGRGRPSVWLLQQRGHCNVRVVRALASLELQTL